MRYVVLGASAAGINGVRQLRKQCPEAEIILVSKDSSIYSRCILHHYLGNMRTKEELCFAEDDFEDRYKADWRKGVTCTGLDDKEKQVFLSDGTSIAYDRLLIATGSHTLLPAVKGLVGTKGAHSFHLCMLFAGLSLHMKTHFRLTLTFYPSSLALSNDFGYYILNFLCPTIVPKGFFRKLPPAGGKICPAAHILPHFWACYTVELTGGF